uniref:Uncharacterized protein n=1 Tax=Arundo donax TaxID=35708 RepID=A0A0A9H1W3_ARUDO
MLTCNHLSRPPFGRNSKTRALKSCPL